MAKATRLPASSERNKDKRRLHLREITEDPHAQLDSVGATLRAARLNRGVDPEQVATTLKMRREHVEAIEDNDFTRLPGRTYAIGFVRSYARYLGLDAEIMVQRFKEESAGREHDKTVDLVFPDAPEEKRSGNGSLFLVALVIAAAIAGAYYVSMPTRHVTTAAGQADEPAIVVADTAAPAPAEPSSVSSNLVQPSSLLAEGAQPAPDGPQIAGASQLTPPQIPPVAAPSVETGRVYGSENADARIIFRATAQAYVLIKQLGNEGKVTVFDRTLNAGESYRAPNKPGVLLITGNAGGLDVEIDGKKLGTLGKSGEMLRNVPVDASYFVEHLAAGSSVAPSPPASAKPAAATPLAPKPAAVKPAAAAAAPKPTPSVTQAAPPPAPPVASSTPAPAPSSSQPATTPAPATPQ